MVISIIALLVGILLPALGAARDTGRAAACLANVKSITQAALMYADDDKGRWVAFTFVPPPGTSIGRKERLDYYLRQTRTNAEFRDVDVWNCPSNLNPTQPNPATGELEVLEASYGLNTRLNGRRLHHVRDHANTVGMSDGGINDDGDPVSPTHLWPPSQPGNSRDNEARPNPRHSDNAHAGWLDGHADANRMEPDFYPGPATVWVGQATPVTDRNDPDYVDQLWDLF